jgi:hypothetical protein
VTPGAGQPVTRGELADALYKAMIDASSVCRRCGTKVYRAESPNGKTFRLEQGSSSWPRYSFDRRGSGLVARIHDRGGYIFHSPERCQAALNG